MSYATVRFNKQDRPGFYKDLRKNVNAYFKESGTSMTGNSRMKIKTVFMLLLYLLPLSALAIGWTSSLPLMYGMWILMGFGMVGIGASVMHDANHGSYSKKKRINQVLGYVVNLVGGYHVTWKVQHNVLHHTFTNVDGFDEDIENALFRFSPHSKNKLLYRFQAFYAPILYATMTIYWFLAKDPIQVKSYGDRGLLKSQGRTPRTAWLELLGTKLGYIGLTLVLPILMLPFPWWQTGLGFIGMHAIAGFSLSLIFQPAHVVNEVEFYKPDGSGHIDNSWAIHQFQTTANYGQSKALNWFIGGLDHQIEHHLFPNICHIHYRNIAPIVKDLASRYNVPYHEHKSFFEAIRSHFILLHRLGTGRFNSGIRVAPV